MNDKFNPETAVPLWEADLGEIETVTIYDGLTMELPGDRQMEVWRVKGKDDVSIKTFRPTEDGKMAILKFGLTYEAANVLYCMLHEQLNRIDSDREKRKKKK